MSEKGAPVPGTSRLSLRDVPRELRAVVAEATARGWRLDRRKGSHHLRLVHDEFRPVPVASSQSESLANRKLKCQIRRAEEGIA
jgi:predicted RNA binding protein YcfA (HicA-like mRNA interferase family)